jgi:hypothetical protein
MSSRRSRRRATTSAFASTPRATCQSLLARDPPRKPTGGTTDALALLPLLPSTFSSPATSSPPALFSPAVSASDPSPPASPRPSSHPIRPISARHALWSSIHPPFLPPRSPTHPPRFARVAPPDRATSLARAQTPNSAWARPNECKPLPNEDIKAFIEEPHRKSGEMLEGYKIALDPSSWEAELAEAKRAHEEAMEGVDELEDDEDGEDEVGTASGAKKRKKTAAPAKDGKGKKAKVEKKAKVRFLDSSSARNPGAHQGSSILPFHLLVVQTTRRPPQRRAPRSSRTPTSSRRRRPSRKSRRARPKRRRMVRLPRARACMLVLRRVD